MKPSENTSPTLPNTAPAEEKNSLVRAVAEKKYEYGFTTDVETDIIETGLRPGEKLYEELLIKTEELDKTENSMIFIERDEPLPLEEIQVKLDMLHQAIDTEDDDAARDALRDAVPTFHKPEEVNREAMKSQEMKMIKEAV